MTTALSHSWHHYVAQPHIDPPYTPQNRLHESDGRWEDIVKTESRALSGDVEAAYRLGTRFDFGEGTPRNSAAALQWYAKASEAGHAKAKHHHERLSRLLELQALGEQGAMSAQYKLALFLEDERREYREAECWFRRAAQQGHNQAKRRLALLLRFGKGATEDIIHNQTVPRNSTEAVKLFREAAARFDPEALFVLGQMYEHEESAETPRDAILALEFYQKATEGGFDPAGNYQSVDMTSLQKAAWLLQRSRAGDPTSAYNLGLYYHDRPTDASGGWRPAEQQYAARWFKVAADAGHDDAAFRLAQMFLHSRGLSLSYRSAFLYLQKPADNGHAQACFELGLMFERGCGVECIDEVQALMWFNEALKNGDVRAAAKIDYLSLWAEFRAERDVSEKPQPSFFLTTSTLHSELGNNTDTISKLNKSIATTTHLSSSQHMAFLLANSSPTAKMNQTIRSTNNATLSSPGAGAALNTTGSNFNTTSFISASTSLLAPLPPTFGIFDVMPKLTATRRVTVDCRTEWRLNGAVPTVNTSFGERFESECGTCVFYLSKTASRDEQMYYSTTLTGKYYRDANSNRSEFEQYYRVYFHQELIVETTQGKAAEMRERQLSRHTASDLGIPQSASSTDTGDAATPSESTHTADFNELFAWCEPDAILRIACGTLGQQQQVGPRSEIVYDLHDVVVDGGTGKALLSVDEVCFSERIKTIERQVVERARQRNDNAPFLAPQHV